MSTIVQLKPTSSLLNSKWAVTGAANVWTALSDGSDASYCQASVDKAALAVALNLGVIPAGKTLNRWRIRVKDSRPVAPGTFTAQCIWWNTSGGTTAVFGQATFSGLRSLITWDNGGWVAAATADPFASIPANTKPALWLASLTDLTSSVVPVEALIEAEYLTPPAVTGVTPSGTVADTNYPTISWTYTSSESLPQSLAYVRVYDQATYSQPGFDPTINANYLWGATISGPGTSVVVGTPLPLSGTFRAYVHAYEDTGYIKSGAAWAYGEFTMAVAGEPPVPDLSGSYSQAANSVSLTAQAHANLLTLEQSSLEGGTTTGLAASTNCAITNSTTVAAHGTHSLRLSSTAAGDMEAATLAGTSGVPVTAGESYTALASFRAAATARSCRVDLRWYDTAGSTLSTVTGTATADSTGAWLNLALTATAPAGAVYAGIRLRVLATGGASELHYIDKIALLPGTAAWSLGGSAGVTGIVLERSNDGGATWLQVRDWPGTDVETNGGVAVDSTVQRYSTSDYEAARPGTVKYRARSVHAYLGGDTLIASDYCTPVTVTTTSDGKVWLKAVTDPSLNMPVRVRRGSFDGTTEEDLGVFRPLGRPGAVVVHGDLRGEDGDALTVMATGATEYAAVQKLAYHQGVLLLQDVDLDEDGRGRQWWISAAAGRQRRRLDNPVHKEITFPYVDCGPGAG